MTLRFTLLTEGSSDQVLIPVLLWTLREHSSQLFEPQWAELRTLPFPPRTLSAKVQAAVTLYPCDLLFVHRDADRTDRATRVVEISAALRDLADPPAVCVVPVRMQEAWFLFHEMAIRSAAGNPHGRMPLSLPELASVEEIPDPKRLLHELLKTASGLGAHRRKRFSATHRVHRVAEWIDDYSPLRRLSAFRAFETELQEVLKSHSWL